MNASRLLLLSTPFTPARLFRAKEQGVWYDPSDLSTLFQDAAGTTPVTAVGQVVGKILDKSGNGNHATQATVANMPTLQVDSTGRYYLNVDGVNDAMATAAFTLAPSDKLTVFCGLYKGSDAARAIFCETSSGSVAGSFSFQAPSSAGANNYVFTSFGTSGANAIASSIVSPVLSVVTGIGDISNTISQIRVNGAVKQTTNTTQGTGTFGNYSLFLFSRSGGTLPFTGRMYGLILRGVMTNDTDVNRAERWMANKTGVAL